ncbi:P-loop containing nucleoside triphosphate hydrolase [Phytophthora cactorum]|nr:P-loop containing nucleoside triphosphate hydrolase [Phytophthora cactorum]
MGVRGLTRYCRQNEAKTSVEELDLHDVTLAVDFVGFLYYLCEELFSETNASPSWLLLGGCTLRLERYVDTWIKRLRERKDRALQKAEQIEQLGQSLEKTLTINTVSSIGQGQTVAVALEAAPSPQQKGKVARTLLQTNGRFPFAREKLRGVLKKHGIGIKTRVERPMKNWAICAENAGILYPTDAASQRFDPLASIPGLEDKSLDDLQAPARRLSYLVLDTPVVEEGTVRSCVQVHVAPLEFLRPLISVPIQGRGANAVERMFRSLMCVLLYGDPSGKKPKAGQLAGMLGGKDKKGVAVKNIVYALLVLWKQDRTYLTNASLLDDRLLELLLVASLISFAVDSSKRKTTDGDLVVFDEQLLNMEIYSVVGGYLETLKQLHQLRLLLGSKLPANSGCATYFSGEIFVKVCHTLMQSGSSSPKAGKSTKSASGLSRREVESVMEAFAEISNKISFGLTTPKRLGTDSAVREGAGYIPEPKTEPKKPVSLKGMMKTLPVFAHREEILENVAANQLTIIQGETGCGKSTSVPQFLYDSWARDKAAFDRPVNIYVTQPRRIAAIELANTVARMREGNEFHEDGQQDEDYLRHHRIHGGAHYSRSRGADEDYAPGPGRSARAQYGCGPAAAIAEASAEKSSPSSRDHVCHMDAQILIKYLGKALSTRLVNRKPLFVGSKLYPVTNVYLDELANWFPDLWRHCQKEMVLMRDQFRLLSQSHQSANSELAKKAISKIHEKQLIVIEKMVGLLIEGQRHQTGSQSQCILIFLPVGAPTRGVQASRWESTKIILSTNIAESSVTIPDVTHVINCAIEKQIEMPNAGSSHAEVLVDTWCSRASALQRSGRAGRVMPGTAFHLFSETFRDLCMAEYNTPELLRKPLDRIILQLKGQLNQFGVPSALLRQALDAPDLSHIDGAYKLLAAFDAIDSDEEEDSRLTSAELSERNEEEPPGKAQARWGMWSEPLSIWLFYMETMSEQRVNVKRNLSGVFHKLSISARRYQTLNFLISDLCTRLISLSKGKSGEFEQLLDAKAVIMLTKLDAFASSQRVDKKLLKFARDTVAGKRDEVRILRFLIIQNFGEHLIGSTRDKPSKFADDDLNDTDRVDLKVNREEAAEFKSLSNRDKATLFNQLSRSANPMDELAALAYDENTVSIYSYSTPRNQDEDEENCFSEVTKDTVERMSFPVSLVYYIRGEKFPVNLGMRPNSEERELAFKFRVGGSNACDLTWQQQRNNVKASTGSRSLFSLPIRPLKTKTKKGTKEPKLLAVLCYYPIMLLVTAPRYANIQLHMDPKAGEILLVKVGAQDATFPRKMALKVEALATINAVRAALSDALNATVGARRVCVTDLLALSSDSVFMTKESKANAQQCTWQRLAMNKPDKAMLEEERRRRASRSSIWLNFKYLWQLLTLRTLSRDASLRRKRCGIKRLGRCALWGLPTLLVSKRNGGWQDSMPKETEFFNAASVVDSSPIKTAETRGRSGSTSSARYRVSSRPTNVLVPSSTDASDPSSRSTEPRLSALLKRMSKNSASTETSGEPKNARFTLTTDSVSPPKGSGATVGTPKLPQKLRQHVSRLRNQFALGSNSASTRTLSLGDRAGKAPRLSISTASINSKRFSIAAAAAIQHSRRSNQFQQLQVPKEDEKPAELVAEVFKRLQEPELTAANPGTFHDLLRPLQSSLSCAFLNTGWSSDEEDEAEQLFRQSERENSRMLRVCCSIDNLMLSIGDQAQEQKQPEAIIRGATRDLQQQQLQNELSGGVGGKVDGKEAQYAKEFLLEINERVGKLYEFAQCVFVNEVDGLRQRITELEEGLAAAVLKNEQLQTEMRDLRDFYEQNNANSVDSFTASSSDSRRPVLDNHSEDPAISALSLPEIPGVNSEAGDDEGNALKQQCHELSRLLELAKQEIRLSHHERDVHKARVAEVSSALFHDSELGMLRNQLQSEKKRVRVLERENLTLREEQVTKLQSLEALQAASLGSPATADSPSVGRQIRPSIDAASSTVVAQQQSVELRRDSPVESTLPMSEVTIDTQENQYNFTNSGITQPGVVQDGAQASVNWFSRIVTPPPQAGCCREEESKARKQGNVPTLKPPMRALSARSAEGSGSRKATSKKRRPQSAAARFLVAVEAQNLLGSRGIGGDPTLGSSISSSSAGSPVTEPVSLSLIVFHFFLERCSREQDAVHELGQFVRCLHSVRSVSYNLELFCQFLEETCSRQELCFFLWVCQAMDDTRLGIPYDKPLPSNYEGTDKQDETPTQFICVLKATFLARTIFRLLHFKVLCRPSTARKSRRRGKVKRNPTKGNTNSAPVSVIAPTSPSNSPKRKPRTRLGELSAVLMVPQTAYATASAVNVTDTGQVEQQVIPPHIAAQTALREIIENNQGEPISLETFNNLLLTFAIAPSPKSWQRDWGLSISLQETNLQWERDQLRALFIHLNHQEEVQQRASEKLAKAEAVNDKVERPKAGEGDKKRPKMKLKRGKSRDRTTEANGGRSWRRSSDITFDGLFDALQRMRWLDSSKLRVDALMEVTGVLPTKRLQSGGSLRGVKSTTKSRASSVAIASPMVHAIREKWRVYARHSLTLCNNDPNVFIRRHSQRLLHYVDQELVGLVSESDNDAAVDCVREFLAFAWRVAAKRSSKNGTTVLRQTCLTEIFLVCQALRPCIDSMSGYHGQFAPAVDKAAGEDNTGILQRRSSNEAAVMKAHFIFLRYVSNEHQPVHKRQRGEYSHRASLSTVLRGALQLLAQVPFHRWTSMMYELELVHPRNLPFVRLQALFRSVVEASFRPDSESPKTITRTLLEAEEIAGRPGRIMAQFCRKILAPRAFASENPLVERNFAAKLSCPLVGRALLEHRSFLRTIFFFYAKQDEVAADERAALEEQALIHVLQENGGRNARAEDPESSAADVSAALLQLHPGADFQLEKTKRSSMSFGEFQTFLTAFDLLSSKVALADAQQVFSSVMALDNDDTLQLEFDEFAAAIVALAVHLDPSPFSLWHQKLDRFATKLHRVWDTQNEGVTRD